jgi:hypothetical protein
MQSILLILVPNAADSECTHTLYWFDNVHNVDNPCQDISGDSSYSCTAVQGSGLALAFTTSL